VRVAHAVILDFNATLAEDEALLLGIYEERLREHGLAFEPGDYPRYAGLPDQAMFGRLFEADGRAAGMRCIAVRGSAYDEASGMAEVVVDRLTVELARTLVGTAP
jgi:beta-phosphoglucomutase-like phosphatase (HAD superfamily)